MTIEINMNNDKSDILLFLQYYKSNKSYDIFLDLLKKSEHDIKSLIQFYPEITKDIKEYINENNYKYIISLLNSKKISLLENENNVSINYIAFKKGLINADYLNDINIKSNYFLYEAINILNEEELICYLNKNKGFSNDIKNFEILLKELNNSKKTDAILYNDKIDFKIKKQYEGYITHCIYNDNTMFNLIFTDNFFENKNCDNVYFILNENIKIDYNVFNRMNIDKVYNIISNHKNAKNILLKNFDNIFLANNEKINELLKIYKVKIQEDLKDIKYHNKKMKNNVLKKIEHIFERIKDNKFYNICERKMIIDKIEEYTNYRINELTELLSNNDLKKIEIEYEKYELNKLNCSHNKIINKKL